MQIKLISYSENKLVAMNVAHRIISDRIKSATGIDEKFIYCSNPQDMFACLKLGIEQADVILIAVDLSKFISTKAALFRALGFKCRLNSEIIDHINSEACMATLNEKQTKAHAAIPVGGEAFVTVDGLFSGVGIKEGRQKLIFVPIDDKRINSIIQNGMISFLLDGAEELYYAHEETIPAETTEDVVVQEEKTEEINEGSVAATAVKETVEPIAEEAVEEISAETEEEPVETSAEGIDEDVAEETTEEIVEEVTGETENYDEIEESAVSEEKDSAEEIDEETESEIEETVAEDVETAVEAENAEEPVQEKIESDIPADMVGYVEHIDSQQYVESATNDNYIDVYSSTSIEEAAEEKSEDSETAQDAYFTPAEILPEENINIGEPDFIGRLRDVVSRGFKVSFARQIENVIYTNFLNDVANVFGVDFVDFPLDTTLTEDIRRKEILASNARRTLRQTNSVFAVSMSELYYGEDNTAYIFVTLADIQKSSVYKIFAADGETAEDLYRIGFESVLEKMEEMVKNANLIPLQAAENNAPVQNKKRISSSTLIGIWVLVIIAVATLTALILDSVMPADGSIISSTEAIIADMMNNIFPR